VIPERVASSERVAACAAVALGLGLALASAACSDSAAGTSTPRDTADASDPAAFDSGTELRVPVPAAGRVFVDLAASRVAAVDGDPKASQAWDIAFEGYDVFTNGGASGAGTGATFGPMDAIAFVEDTAPAVPLLFTDRPGGAFLDWYLYSGAPAHALYTRYHVFGVREGARTWKLQVLGYYGQRDGAPVSALYSVRYAEVLAGGGAGPTTELTQLDGTAGGPQAPPTARAECLDLASGARTMLLPAEAATSTAWHVCFRRQSITVNGELGGPRGVAAVDLDVESSKAETASALEAKTPESERARFDAVNADSFVGKAFRGDRIVSGFGELWVDRKVTPVIPAYAAWLVVGRDGKKYLLGFRAFDGATATTPGTVVMRIKPVKG